VEVMMVSKWMLVIALGLLTHFGASYLVPLEAKDQGALGGFLRWVWPWGMGDSGILGQVTPGVMPLGGFWIAMAAAVLSAMAALAVLGIWVPTSWWRPLAIIGASLLVLVMVGFFGPTKILPILAGLAMIWVVTLGSDALNLT
jgi:hypothetical protein